MDRSAGRPRALHAPKSSNDPADYELAVALANATEGTARSTVLKATQVDLHGKHWSTCYAPKSSNDPAKALQPIQATPKRCKGRKGIEGEAHGMVIESGRVRASIQSD